MCRWLVSEKSSHNIKAPEAHLCSVSQGLRPALAYSIVRKVHRLICLKKQDTWCRCAHCQESGLAAAYRSLETKTILLFWSVNLWVCLALMIKFKTLIVLQSMPNSCLCVIHLVCMCDVYVVCTWYCHGVCVCTHTTALECNLSPHDSSEPRGSREKRTHQWLNLFI